MEDKYKQFRNFMFNELGITRKDIEQWTREAINERVDAVMKRIVNDEVINKAIDKSVAANARDIFNGWQTKDMITSAIARVIQHKLVVNIKDDAPEVVS